MVRDARRSRRISSIDHQRKEERCPVVLKSTIYAGKTDDDKYYDEVKYFTVNGTYKNQTGIRSGVYFKKSGYDFKDESSLTNPTNYTLVGAYGGIEILSQAFVKTKVGDDFKYGSGQTRLYFDALFVPVRSLADESLGDPEKNGVLGFRAGMQWNKKPHKEKESGFELHPVYTAEGGVRPISGFYIQISLGLIVLSK